MSTAGNLAASVKARLKNAAVRRGEDFNLLLLRYGIERLLYRLSKSPHTGRFLLKGAMLFVVWDDTTHRPTRDLDLLGFGSVEERELTGLFQEIVRTEVVDDGIAFDPSSVAAEKIREDDAYGGIRVRIAGKMGSVRITVQIDVGAGDAVTPAAETVAFPTLLDFPAPRVLAYPIYTVVAEKFEALVTLGDRNTRMKDFHDLWYLSRRFDFDGAILNKAIVATFKRRGTPLGGDLLPFTDGFGHAADRQKHWQGFLARNGLQGPPVDFPEVMQAIREFLTPALRANTQRWHAGKGWE
jgi:hypothetical protein